MTIVFLQSVEKEMKRIYLMIGSLSPGAKQEEVSESNIYHRISTT